MELQSLINTLNQKINPQLQEKLLIELEHQISSPSFWLQKDAPKISSEYSKLKSTLNSLNQINQDFSSLQEYLESFPNDQDSINLEQKILANANSLLIKISFQPIDESPAIIHIYPGSGGTESTNWAFLLLQMYLKYSKTKLDNPEILSIDQFSHDQINHATIKLNFPLAYGFLKHESGPHRLIRISPYSPTKQRHTSFAAIQVSPDIDETIEIHINPSDLQWETMTNSGPGGQNVNKVESAVRLKHIPSNIIINSRSSRDQHQNRSTALKILKSKLYQIELDKINNLKSQFTNNQDPSFGHQIRSYILDNPLVKDHRSDFISHNPQDILNGNIQELLNKNILT